MGSTPTLGTQENTYHEGSDMTTTKQPHLESMSGEELATFWKAQCADWQEIAGILDKALTEALYVIELGFNTEPGERNDLSSDNRRAAGRLLYRHRGDRWNLGGDILTRRP